MSHSILIYCPFSSNRLLYVLDWIFKTRLGIDYSLTTLQPDASVFYLSYGAVTPSGINIPSFGLLSETGIKQHEIKIGEWNNIPTLYTIEKKGYYIPFDFFSAVFFLLSRYEEYYRYIPDKHGRYPATDSILYKNGWLERPLVDEWIEQLRLLFIQHGIAVPQKAFCFQPTYDIDIAWSYKNKGLVRTAGGFIKDVFTGRIAQVTNRLSVLSGTQQDPYFSFDVLKDLHSKYQYTPLYFVLAALQTGEFDKNISPLHTEMQQLIQSFAKEGTVGIHPSYNMKINDSVLVQEKTVLEKITENAITTSRQHYIRLWFPNTYQQLIAAGITDDYSMGYGTQLGFRAGTGASFKWFDIENDCVSSLTVHPFCFMDSTAHYDLNLSAADAFLRLEKMTVILKHSNSRLITVFHNFSLGTTKEWNGWVAKYASFLQKMAE